MGGVDISAYVVVALVLTAFAAGWIDAVVGGGGLIQLPALIIALPDTVSVPEISATNKTSSVAGTLMASITYVRNVRLDWRSLLPLVVCAFVGSTIGAQLVRFLPREYFTPIVFVALVVVGVYTWRRTQLGQVNALKHTGARHYARTAGIGGGVGVYDGFVGPGTGSFFVILLVAVLGYGFLEASAQAKLANLATNVAALSVFAFNGQLLLALGGAMAAANFCGGFVGAKTAIKHGNGFIRKVFLGVLAVLAVKLGYDSLGLLIG